MEYTLTHKDIPILDLDLDEARKSAILSAFGSRRENPRKLLRSAIPFAIMNT